MINFVTEYELWTLVDYLAKINVLGSINKKRFAMLSQFWLLKGWWGGKIWVNLLKKENLWQKPIFRCLMKFLKVVKYNTYWCKSLCITTRNKRTGGIYLWDYFLGIFKTSMQCKKGVFFHLILVVTPSSLVLSIKNNRGEEVKLEEI